MSKSRRNIALSVMLGAYLAALHTGRRRVLRASIPEVVKAPENALVLGSGGLLGAAWMASTLSDLENKSIWKPEIDDLRIGTSAGSMLAVILGNGIKASEIVALMVNGDYQDDKGILSVPKTPTREKVPLRPSDILYAVRSLAQGRAPHLGIIVSSLFVEGAEDTSELETFINEITNSNWPSTNTWLVSAELQSGLRKVFTGKDEIAPGEAVAASCAVPALYRPVKIKGGQYIDGGTISCSNLDLAIHARAKNIIVLTPIAGYTRININSGVNKALSQIVRNTEQIGMSKIFKKIGTDTKITLVTPGKATSEFLSTNSLMDGSKVKELLEIMSSEEPVIMESK